ncbi:MAG: ABC transporter ATP-binding protein [Patescibacteria group bacterium]|jgi:ATP-binding cassette subfamily B protein
MKDNTKKTFGFYFQAIKRHKLLYLVIFMATMGAVSADVIVPIYFKDFFNQLVSGLDKDLVVKSLVSLLIIITVVKFVQWVFWRIAGFSMDHAMSKTIAELSDICFAYLHKHSFTFFSNSFVGSLVKRVKWFTGAFEVIFDNIFFSLLPLALYVIAAMFVLVRVNVYLALAIFIWTIIFLIINWSFTKYKLKYDIIRNEMESKSSGVIADTITNNNNVKLFNGYHKEIKDFAKVTDDLRRIRRFAWNLGDLFEAIQGLLMLILEMGVFFLAVYLWRKGLITLGDFVLIQAYVIDIFMRVWNFGKNIRRIYESLSDAEEMTQILVTPHEIVDIPGAKKLKVTTGKIEFQKVLFNYNETRSVLKNFNLVIAPHQRLAIIGPSGAGKTTIVKLLFRMHEVTGGKILLDGQDISRVTQESLWANISLVPQDPILFHRTLMENIRYGRFNATDKEVIRAAKLAHCHDFIMSSPDGYNTYVGERGIKLSGGERQRVAIARAILRDAPILVLDEATSSLDSESEHLIQDALEKLMKHKTVIVIAHRLSTIRQMDRIVVVDKGGIIEDGSHGDLTKKKEGLYQRLWQFQAGGFIK